MGTPMYSCCGCEWIRAERENVVCEAGLFTLQDMWLSVVDPVERPPRPSDTSVIGNLGVVRRPSRARPAPAALSICSITSSTAVATFELERRGSLYASLLY